MVGAIWLLLSSVVWAQAASFPAESDWEVATSYAGLSTDPCGDQSGGASLDIVGTDEHPAVFQHDDGTHLWFRIRVADSPVSSNGKGWRSFGWGVFLEVDGDSTSWDYNLSLMGNKDIVWLGENTSASSDFTKDKSESTLESWSAEVAEEGSGDEDYAAWADAGTDLCEDGGGDYFLTWYAPWSDITAETGATSIDELVTVFGSSPNGKQLSGDLAGCDDTLGSCTSWADAIAVPGDTADTGDGALEALEEVADLGQVFAGRSFTYSEFGVAAPSVVWDGSQFVMAFESRSTTSVDGCKRAYEVGIATSSDGLTWQQVSQAAVEPDAGTYHSCVAAQPALVFDGSDYHLYFASGQSSTACDEDTPVWGCARRPGIGYASSTDLSTWSVSSEPVLNEMGVGHPAVVEVGGSWTMVIIQGSDMFQATSDDGLEWVLDTTPIVEAGEGHSFMNSQISSSSLNCDENAENPLRLHFKGKNTAEAEDNGVGTASAPTSRIWDVGYWPILHEAAGDSVYKHIDVVPDHNGDALLYYSDIDADGDPWIGVAQLGSGKMGEPVSRSCSSVAGFMSLTARGTNGGDAGQRLQGVVHTGCTSSAASPALALGLLSLLGLALRRRVSYPA